MPNNQELAEKIKLENCPFCGSPARRNSETGNNVLEWVECSKCWASTKTSANGQELVAAWNTRSGSDLVAERDRYKKALEHIRDRYKPIHLAHDVAAKALEQEIETDGR